MLLGGGVIARLAERAQHLSDLGVIARLGEPHGGCRGGVYLDLPDARSDEQQPFTAVSSV
jgi:hypothetical protein